ncbi:MAG TPA: hypothetical protein VN613_02050 [Gemmatimonadaceae bacterium]|nr:hypothetical protein [Gemmatimonadaceae bacterium]
MKLMSLVAEKFAFVVEPDGTGWRARTLTGTVWVALGFRCPSPGCKAAITEHGVSGPTP